MLEDEQAVVQKEDDSTMFWHRRLGNFHHKILLFMKKNLGEGLPDLEEEFPTCTIC